MTNGIYREPWSLIATVTSVSLWLWAAASRQATQRNPPCLTTNKDHVVSNSSFLITGHVKNKMPAKLMIYWQFYDNNLILTNKLNKLQLSYKDFMFRRIFLWKNESKKTLKMSYFLSNKNNNLFKKAFVWITNFILRKQVLVTRSFSQKTKNS